jgi:hypothetical protein
MATIDSKEIIDTLLNNNGYFPGDPQIYMIVEYTNHYGNKTWGVTWPHEKGRDRYLVESDYVRNPTIIWQRQRQ